MNFRALKGSTIAAALLFLVASGCTDTVVAPKSNVNDANVFQDPSSYQELLAKVYAGLSATGQQGPAGNPDLAGFDEGFSQYLRLYFELQELPTEEAMIAWGGDGDLMDLNRFVWSSTNGYSSIFYSRVFYLVSLANSFLFQTTDDKLDSRGVSPTLKTQIHQYRAEARFLRAFAYWNALDLFGNVPIITTVSTAIPPQATRDSVYNFVVNELTAIEDSLPQPGASTYGRATTQAAHMLLAEVYLNAGVYTGAPNWAGAMTEASEVIGSGAYTMATNDAYNFTADNGQVSPEIIFAITEDGVHTRNYGATTFIVHAECGNNLDGSEVGIPGQCWWGLRLKPQADTLYFGAAADHPAGDLRANALYRTNQTLAISTPTDFTQGTLLLKFTNKTSTGGNGSDPYFVDTDFPVFRLTEAYLIRAEAALRLGSAADSTTALNDINLLRARAYGDAVGDSTGYITKAQLTLPFILDERGRELIWEAHRRTDLIRFGQFGGAATYNWDWKGGNQTGAAVAGYYNLYPIPEAQIAIDPDLKQNPGY
jgi:hypothetical protein